ncbi:TPA: DUF2442 domain-containing protein [Citrobacter freundii]|uniref:DUF2442 domain-containing protein n=1 Tax=Citrobacter pasteurii TaxID=1563222 RepID=A0A6N6JX12_9ENTR|nr:DUF2442 domain-containing protein [Citrobacter freundii]KAA1271618.1 DUF2442 domain-containing protein [Citrobacter pasteurii]MBS6210756.1 DUF2442 domain-containing protein [Proteus hauseri]HBM9969977.1 DUF2442 domain-containing protein [Enterobacter chengduensis]EKW7469830.1 DUF2442 domain-containing protein [Citrobacter freundii]
MGSPLFWYPRLEHDSLAQRMAYELSFEGIHWLEFDEDLCVEGILAGGKSSQIRE